MRGIQEQAGAPSHARRPRRIDLIALAIAAYFAAYVGWRVFGWGGEALALAINDFMLIPLGLVSVALALVAARRAPTRQSRRGWLLLAAAFGAYCLGDITWFQLEVLSGIEVPYPSIADAAYLAYYPFTLLGLSSLAHERDEQATLFGLDLAIVVVAAGTIIFVGVLAPVADAASGPVDLALALAYPIGDTLVLFAAAAALMRRLLDTSRPAVVLLAAGMALNVVADLAYVTLSLQDAYTSGSWPDTAYMVGWLCTAAAAWLQARVPSSATVSEGSPRAILPNLPYLAVALLYGVLIYVSTESGPHVRAVVYGAVVLTCLVVARQLLLGRENARLQARQAALRVESRFRALIQSASDVIAVTDGGGLVNYVTPSAARVLGRAPDDLVGTPIWGILDDDAGAARSFLASATEHEGRSGPVEWHAGGGGTDPVAFEVTATNLIAHEDVGGLVFTLRDITERKAFERQLEHQALHDPLTGLANRVLLADRLAHALARARRRPDRPAVIYLDLDDFKRVNDTRGHTVGDRVLFEVAQRISATVREGDTAARLGGDEFAVLLEETTDVDEAEQVAARIRDALTAPVQLDEGTVVVSASMGIVRAADLDVTSVDLMRESDIAMYAAKRDGRGTFRTFEPAMAAEAVARVALEDELLNALARSEFDIAYQVQTDLLTRRIVGVEGLLRWRHPRRGSISPLDFIPVAERTGLIVPIGRWVLEEVCRTVGGWNRDLDGEVRASVNVSLRQFEPAFVDIVADVLRRTAFPARLLTLELTETMLVADDGVVRGILDDLRSLGVRVSIDDFGTGYSSLSYLHELPVDEIKIDRSFVAALSERGDEAVVTAIIELAARLGVPTVAEGIELASQAETLRRLGCRFGQGFIFGRPAPPITVREQVRAQLGEAQLRRLAANA